MNYVSTRGTAPAVSFLGAMIAGLAPDGGLYVPERWPELSEGEIAAFAGRPYAEVAADVVGRFAGDSIDRVALADICADAYSSFDHAAVAPLKQLSPGGFLLELFHGPTLAFKDIALQLLGRLYDHVLGQQGRRLTIVCATSGDTGGAAVEAFRGRANVRLVALFPQGRISEVQRRFMTTTAADNVACLEVKGTFDDCQAMLKA
ncbi:MAG TPA: threonine synthase, partial [Caulobacteraceae bacterium]|nr:threonine synthase [Caulobacteraceae bacterium]